MSIKFECPKCKKQLEAENDYVGMRLDCPQCNEEVIVPKPTLKVSKQETNTSLSSIPKIANPQENTNTAGLFDFKNASPQARDIAYNVIASRTNDFQRFLAFMLTRKNELKHHLHKILLPNEQVLAFVSGRMPVKIGGQVNGKGSMMAALLVLTERRIIFIFIGLAGMKQAIIFLDKVNSIACQTGLFFSEITITEAAGSRLFDWVDRKGGSVFVEIVQNTMAGHYQQYFYSQGNESKENFF